MDDTTISIKLAQNLTLGTDASCEKFKKTIDKLLENKHTITITNKGWIPSQTKTITRESWSKLWQDET